MKIKIHREGRNLICGTALLLFIINVLVFLYFPHWLLGITLSVTALLLVFVTYFFRNPVRVLEVDDPNFIIAPADGRVVAAMRRKCIGGTCYEKNDAFPADRAGPDRKSTRLNPSHTS